LGQGQCARVIDHSEVLPTPLRLPRNARWKAQGALLADNANTLRELIDLVKKKEQEKREVLQKFSLFGEKRSIATHVNLQFVAEPSKYASDRSKQLKKQESAMSQHN
jgi:hypothetical protein